MPLEVTGIKATTKTISKVQKTTNDLPKTIFNYDFKTGIIKRTQKGLDMQMKAFTGYSAAYKKQKMKRKYKSYNGVVNMTLDFNMLASIARKKIVGGVRYYFNNKKEEDKAVAHQKGLGNLPKRKFFGIDKRQKKTAMKFINKKIRVSTR